MSTAGIKRIVVLGAIPLAIASGLGAFCFSFRSRVEIRGALSPGDVAEITR